MLRVTPISGSRFSEHGPAEDPSCTLVEFSGVRVLINVGRLYSSSTGSSAADKNAAVAPPPPPPPLPPHDCVFLTDSTFKSVGGLAQYYEQQIKVNNGLVPPIYATFPTVKMGQMTLYDHHAAVCMDGGHPDYSLQSVDDVFSSIVAIKYSQTVHLGDARSHNSHGSSSSRHRTSLLQVVAHRSGHVVGGAFFVLRRTQDETVVVVADSYHISRQLHLDSCTLLKHASTPDVFVCHPGGASARNLLSSCGVPSVLVSQAQRNLTETILSVLRRDGNVLLPVDCAGRVLELVLALDMAWEKQRLGATYNLVWLAPMCTNVSEFARSQLEWMNTKLGTQFDTGVGSNPYALKSVRFCTSAQELWQVMEEGDDSNNPTCVLASGLDMENGPARDVLLRWAGDADNAIVFTDSSGCLLRQHGARMGGAAAATVFEPSSNAGSAAVAVGGGGSMTGTTPAQSMMERSISATTTTSALVPPDDDPDAETEERDGLVLGETLTETSIWTSSGQLLKAWATAKQEDREMEDVVVIDVNVPTKAPLAGQELTRFLRQEEAARLELARAQEKRRMLAQVEQAKGELHLEQEEEQKTPSVTTSKAAIKGRPKKKSRFDSSLFLKFSKPLHVTFEVREQAVGIGQTDEVVNYGIGDTGKSDVVEDDYGISVQPELFTDIVSGVDPSKFAGGSGRIGDDVLRRGFGYGVDGTTKANSSKKSSRAISEDEGQGDEDEFDEQALEALDLSEGNGIIRGRSGHPPMKVSTVPRKVEVLAEVTYVAGLEGRVDTRAARQTVMALQPREVIVLGGTRDSNCDGEAKMKDQVRILADATKSSATGSKIILTPSDGEDAELMVGHAAYGARLVDTPFLTEREKEEMTAAPEPVEPFEAKLGPCNVSLVDCLATGQKSALDDSIVLAPRPSLSSLEGPSIYLSDGEVLLTDLRAELIASGMKAEYSARAGYSQLIVNGKIFVRKEHQDTSGRMQVEGPLCQDFYKVRSVVCGQYVIL